MTPSLSTQSLSLRQLRKATQRHVDWLNDPEVVQFSEQRHRMYMLATCRSYINSFDGETRHIWAIDEVATGRHIGNITADIDPRNNVAELAILIGDRASWGKGYGTQAWRAVTDWLLGENGARVRKVEAGAMSNNAGMRRIMERANFQFEGEKRLHFLWNGQPVGLTMYGRFA